MEEKLEKIATRRMHFCRTEQKKAVKILCASNNQ